MTQKELVREHLYTHGTLTQATALLLYGIGRLAARINDLKEDGESIKQDIVKVKKRNGSYAWVAKYYLGES